MTAHRSAEDLRRARLDLEASLRGVDSPEEDEAKDEPLGEEDKVYMSVGARLHYLAFDRSDLDFL